MENQLISFHLELNPYSTAKLIAFSSAIASPSRTVGVEAVDEVACKFAQELFGNRAKSLLHFTIPGGLNSLVFFHLMELNLKH